jgi:hypothetical protein
MMCCDMCGKEIKSCSDQRYIEIITRILFANTLKYEKTICSKCSKKLKKFIAYERARNNKRRCEND